MKQKHEACDCRESSARLDFIQQHMRALVTAHITGNGLDERPSVAEAITRTAFVWAQKAWDIFSAQVQDAYRLAEEQHKDDEHGNPAQCPNH